MSVQVRAEGGRLPHLIIKMARGTRKGWARRNAKSRVLGTKPRVATISWLVDMCTKIRIRGSLIHLETLCNHSLAAKAGIKREPCAPYGCGYGLWLVLQQRRQRQRDPTTASSPPTPFSVVHQRYYTVAHHLGLPVRPFFSTIGTGKTPLSVHQDAGKSILPNALNGKRNDLLAPVARPSTTFPSADHPRPTTPSSTRTPTCRA